jgi:putative transcriptional regulator
VAYKKGELRANARKITIIPIQKYEAKDIRRIRNGLKLPQPVFADLLGVSKKTVEAWESGRNIPQGYSPRLLELLDRNGLALVKDFVRTTPVNNEEIKGRVVKGSVKNHLIQNVLQRMRVKPQSLKKAVFACP